MTTFVLVHGAWHGAWCWEQLTPELEARGHRVTTMDLPSDVPTETFSSYADVVCAALDAGPAEDAVVVGHSLAGLTVPLVADRRPVRRLVYLCGLVPAPGRSFAEQLGDEPDMLNPAYLAGMGEPDAERRREWVDEGTAREVLYADCDDDVAHAAFERLRPQAMSPYGTPCPLDRLPDVPTSYVVCREDRLVNPEWSRRVAGERLHAELVQLPGSHSPFLSRPAALADVLTALV